MKILNKLKSALNRIAKKHRSRTRVKGTYFRDALRRSRVVTDAQLLVQNNYGLTFSNPKPPRAGVKRAEERLIKHRKIWAAS